MDKIELIDLTLDEIRRKAHIIDGIRNNLLWSTYIKKQNTIEKIVESCENQLEDIRLRLRKTLGDVLEFMNANDMNSAVDIALSEVPLSLISEEKNEQDFED